METIVYHAVAERTVMLSKDVSFSSCSDIGRSHEISYIIVVPSSKEKKNDRKKGENIENTDANIHTYYI